MTILETLRNADINIRGYGTAQVQVAKDQVHNAYALLEKGYSIHAEVETLLEKHGGLENVPAQKYLLDPIIQISRNQFLSSTDTDRQIFITKLIHAIRNNDISFMHAYLVVYAAEKNGMFKNVKFGAEVFNKVVERDLIASQYSEPQQVFQHLFFHNKTDHMYTDPKNKQEGEELSGNETHSGETNTALASDENDSSDDDDDDEG